MAEVRGIFHLIFFYRVVRPRKAPSLELLKNLEVAQKIQQICQDRKVTPGRIYQIFSLICEILDYLAKNDPTSGAPPRFPSYNFVIQTKKREDGAERKRRTLQSLAPPKHALLSASELRTLGQKCTLALENLTEISKKSLKNDEPVRNKREYLAHLVVLTLVTIPPPRAQIFTMLEIGKTFLFNAGIHAFSFNSIDPPLKSAKPLHLELPQKLASFYQIWIEIFRPSYAHPECSLLFPNQTGRGPIKKWCPLTTSITNRYLNKSVPISKFRNSVVTAAHADPNFTEKVSSDLAAAMQHSVRTQKTYYAHVSLWF